MVTKTLNLPIHNVHGVRMDGRGEYGGGEPDVVQWDTSSSGPWLRWNLGAYAPTSIDGNDVTIDEIRITIHSTVSPVGNLYLHYWDEDRVGNPNHAGVQVASTTTHDSIGTDTYEMILDSADSGMPHTITDDTFGYHIEMGTSSGATTYRIMGGTVTFSYTAPTIPYQVVRQINNGANRKDKFTGGNATYWHGFNNRYSACDSADNIIEWNLSEFVPTTVDDYGVRIDEIYVWWWHAATRTGTLRLTSYTADRINDQSGSAIYSTTTTAWESYGGSYAWAQKLTPAHWLVDNDVYTIACDGVTNFSSGPRIQGARIKYTVQVSP